MTKPLVIAHRGYSARYPENTIASYEAAIAMGADIIESDARLSSDSVAFSCHDADFKRLLGDVRTVAEMTEAELKAIVLPDGSRPLLLEEVLEQISPFRKVLIDVKTQDAAIIDVVIADIRKTGALADVWVGVRDLNQARQIKAAEPNVAVLAFLPDYTRAAEFAAAGATAFRVWEGHLGQAAVQALFPRLPVWVTMGHMETPYCVGDTDPERLAKVLALKPSGVLINDLSLMLPAPARDFD
ncbi:glycerophosphodiester phosphodiesterase [Bosea sp. NBC_00550]|uniref:glycerophosphodiester phosphodiesterase n=1 Tax=Bosea sp. NBC_00550 TaxID=2969621 RepID=UPI00222FCEF2|nr:glycerophosphodiester phosphodiesterase family protein [Bosea sp. NBC_00550]UZF94984.1 glycerophosphodiester phosphodiesterase family protein [Bosea sp. NBC_00550]